jgi:glycosyltransferase involved in cell wall biosynthesis
MKIVFLLTVGLERPSGLRYAGLARGLVSRGHQVTILALHPDYAHAKPRLYQDHGVEVRYVGQMHARKQGSTPGRFGPLQLLQVVTQSTVALAAAAARTSGDVIHLGKPQPINGMAALIANRARPRPLFLDCDDYEAGSNRFSADWQRTVFAWWEDRLPTQAQGVTVNTRFLGERVAGLGVPREHIVHVPNGVDLKAWHPANPAHVTGLRTALRLENRRVIAYAGTLSLQNHPVDLLIDAMPAIIRREPRTTLLLIGGGEDLPLIRERLARTGLDQAVYCTGHVSRPALRVLLGLAELTVDPVFDDAVARARSPLKIFESMALGVPIVTADVGDRRVLLADGRAGILVQPGSPMALADGINQLLEDQPALQTARTSAIEHVKAFDWKQLATSFETVYRV